VTALYERGLVYHAGSFIDLEDTMCSWLPGTKSPDRMDALVWTMFSLAKGLSPERLVSFAGVPDPEEAPDPQADQDPEPEPFLDGIRLNWGYSDILALGGN
jgi:hypothetical protein